MSGGRCFVKCACRKEFEKKNEKEKEKNMFKIRYTQPLFESSMVIKVNFLIYFDKNR